MLAKGGPTPPAPRLPSLLPCAQISPSLLPCDPSLPPSAPTVAALPAPLQAAKHDWGPDGKDHYNATAAAAQKEAVSFHYTQAKRPYWAFINHALASQVPLGRAPTAQRVEIHWKMVNV